jgi:hypothetical protein
VFLLMRSKLKKPSKRDLRDAELGVATRVLKAQGMPVWYRGWGILKTQLKYKSHEEVSVVKEVSESFSTQECSACASRSGPKGLGGGGLDLFVLRSRARQKQKCYAEHFCDRYVVNALFASSRYAGRVQLEVAPA